MNTPLVPSQQQRTWTSYANIHALAVRHRITYDLSKSEFNELFPFREPQREPAIRFMSPSTNGGDQTDGAARGQVCTPRGARMTYDDFGSTACRDLKLPAQILSANSSRCFRSPLVGGAPRDATAC